MKKLIAIAALLFATSAYADPLVSCISGCQKPGGLKLKAGETQITSMWWFGPSVGLSLAARDSATGVWEQGINFAFQYGVKFRPPWWTATNSFLSVDLGLSAGNISTAGSDFKVTVAPTLTLLDVIAVGYGPRFAFVAGGPTKTSGVLFLGLSTSLGSP